MTKKKLIFTAILSIIITATLFAILSFKSVHKNGTTANAVVQKMYEKVKFAQNTERITDKGRNLIHNQLRQQVYKKMDKKINSKSFSRCPSGLQYRILESPSLSSPYFKGILKNYQGCSARQVCMFRMDASEEVLEVFNKATNSYQNVNDWLAIQDVKSLAWEKLEDENQETTKAKVRN